MKRSILVVLIWIVSVVSGYCWQQNGVAVCTANNTQSAVRQVFDGSGGSIIVWQDERNSNSDIYAQHIDSTGSSLWMADGIAVCTAAKNQQNPAIVADGVGGAYVVWQDTRDELANSADIYIQRINSSGVALWAANGKALSTDSGNQINPSIAQGNNGVMVAWYSSGNMCYQLVNSVGSTLLINNAIAGSAVYSFSRVAANSSGFWLVYYSGLSTAVAQRISFAGVVGSSYNYPANEVDLAADSAGFYLAAVSNNQLTVYRQSADTVWSVLVCTTARNPKVFQENGNVFVTWEDIRGTSADIYLQKISANGVAQWSVNGLAVCTAANTQSAPVLVGDSLGGVIATWFDYRTGSGFDIYAQRVNTIGEISMANNGYAVCTANSSQQLPQIIADGKNGAIITWQDYRNGNYDVYAGHIDSSMYIVPGLPPSNVSFYGSPTVGIGSFTVNFYATATAADYFNWTFGDGGTGSGQNPIHQYGLVTADSRYSIRLIAGNSFGEVTVWRISYIFCQGTSTTVSGQSPAITSFTATPSSGYAPLVVTFYGSASGDNVSWQVVGNGWSASGATTSHTFGDLGYDYWSAVTAIASNSFGSATAVLNVNILSQTARKPAITSFTATPSSGYAPLTTNFLVGYTGASVAVTISGNGWSSFGPSLQHIYADTGADYVDTVQAVVTNAFGAATANVTVNVLSRIVRKPTVTLSADPLSGYAELTVNYQATVTGDASGMQTMIYGSGWATAAANAITVYSDKGVDSQDTVKAVVTNDFGSDTAQVIVTILSRTYHMVSPGFYANPTSGFAPLSVNFVDTSANATDHLWYFGDGGYSTATNPTHLYLDAGHDTTYMAWQMAGNEFGYRPSAQVPIYVMSSVARIPQCNFYAAPTSGRGNFTVWFFDQSVNNPTSWSWDFGDGGISDLQNPSHVYSLVTSDQVYSVRLVVSNAFGISTLTRVNYIYAMGTSTASPGQPPSGVNFYATPTVGIGNFTVNFYGIASGANSWSWDFGDGQTGSGQNTLHQYQLVTTDHWYNVRMIAANSFGAITVSRPNYIYAVGTSTTVIFNPIAGEKVPSLKLFINQGLGQAFDINRFTSSTGSNWLVVQNFNGLASLDGSSVSQAAYSSATIGNNYFTLSSITAWNKVKYSTYKIKKLPAIGLNPGDWLKIDLANKVTDSYGQVIPPSFGSPSSLRVGDLTKVAAYWIGNTTIQIVTLSGFTAPTYVDVIAAPATTIGGDFDKERIELYPNLLPNCQFKTAADTSQFAYELAEGLTSLPTISWQSSISDVAGNQASGVLRVTFSNSSQGLKATASIPNWFTYQAGQWYTARIRVYSAETTKYQVLLYNYNNPVPQADQVDLAANVYTVAPNIWSWLEVPLYVHATGLGYPQFMLKADKLGTVFVDEVQVINAAPKLMSPRGDVKSHFAYGDWDKFSDFSGWGAEGGEFFVQDCGSGQLDLQLGRTGQPVGTENKAKFTAIITPGGPIYTPRVTAGREVGTAGEVKAIYSGFTTLSSAVIVAAYGVATEGAYEIAGQEDVANNFLATAQFGKIVPGPIYAIGIARNNWYQFQFIAKDIIPGGRISLGPIDFWSDADDPNFGDPDLYINE